MNQSEQNIRHEFSRGNLHQLVSLISDELKKQNSKLVEDITLLAQYIDEYDKKLDDYEKSIAAAMSSFDERLSALTK